MQQDRPIQEGEVGAEPLIHLFHLRGVAPPAVRDEDGLAGIHQSKVPRAFAGLRRRNYQVPSGL
ncbi:MAG: hypothetical protein GEEBNDBF_01604 [bacterium]|nr:hypothetical protein [bacterium]